jgi:hypothetical protein
MRRSISAPTWPLNGSGKNLTDYPDFSWSTNGKRKMTKLDAGKDCSPVIRNSAGLRDAIFDEIDAIRSGRSSPTRANAVAKLATGIVETVRMEIEVQRHLRTSPALVEEKPVQQTSNSNGLGAPLPLGNPRA